MSRTEDRSQAMLASVAQSLALGLLVVLSHATNARSQPSPAPSPAPASTPAQQTLKVEELDQLVSPIALYPDTLLASVLMASTYPLEVVEASRWADENKSLKGEALKAATDKQSWDDSIKQLTATPSVLNMMSTKLSWTKQLGDAVLAQQPDVMDAVQRLRARAQANKMLESTKEQKVSVRTEQSKQVIVIEPTEPNTIYVPYYNPAVVYGAWPYPAYPPYYYPPVPGYYAGAAIATGLAFGAGIAVGAWAARGFWGGGIGWGNNNINVNRNVNINNANINNWSHNPAHRQGVRYNNADVANKFNRGADARGGAQNRMDYRGRDGQQVLRPSQGGGAGAGAGNRGDRPQTLDKGGAGQRQNASNKGGAGQRQAADKAGAGQRQNAANRGGDQRPSPSNRSGAGGGGGGREQAFSNVGSGGRNAMAQSARGNASLGGGGGHANIGAGGGGGRGGGGGFQGGGGGGRGGGGGGGRRSDINLKHDIVLLGHLNNGLGFYRYSYNGSDKPYVGVMAQEVQVVMPDAVTRGSDGYLRVHYEKLGVKFQTYGQWIASGGQIPATARNH